MMKTISALALAIFGIANVLTGQDGPADILRRFRRAVGAYRMVPDPLSPNGMRAATNLGRVFGCPYCIGVWLALVAAIAMGWRGERVKAAAIAAASYGGHAVLVAMTTRPNTTNVRIINPPNGGV